MLKSPLLAAMVLVRLEDLPKGPSGVAQHRAEARPEQLADTPVTGIPFSPR